MKTFIERISAISQMNDENIVEISHPRFVTPKPGQYMLAYPMGSTQLLPTVLFGCGDKDGNIMLCGEIEDEWSPGMEISMRGPFGNGFHLPPFARKMAMISLKGNTTNVLIHLASVALQNPVEVTFLSDTTLPQLPSEIEILPVSALKEMSTWADYVAMIAPLTSITWLQDNLSTNSFSKTNTCEVLIETNMVCGGIAECGLCSVHTTQGWKYACKDGPVFSLFDLVSEEYS